jgi:hypothetical protein
LEFAEGQDGARSEAPGGGADEIGLNELRSQRRVRLNLPLVAGPPVSEQQNVKSSQHLNNRRQLSARVGFGAVERNRSRIGRTKRPQMRGDRFELILVASNEDKSSPLRRPSSCARFGDRRGRAQNNKFACLRPSRDGSTPSGEEGRRAAGRAYKLICHQFQSLGFLR